MNRGFNPENSEGQSKRLTRWDRFKDSLAGSALSLLMSLTSQEEDLPPHSSQKEEDDDENMDLDHDYKVD